ncbi:putative ABC transporter ATP-binding protein [Frankia canadensis]|uniref:Putative ABC transporter ATP-binding protein n=1 Tax=Frankia canadensis TaxID=1836972 RepID=A0A2I2L2P2_9ACTN|nr:ATP-binding cassette domain-containing protein [Frankia canadensis]SNQ52168.1 putative ABC transporter ATP-binding protein [Frankia canadensis]SOU59458.1 putative ABC transporter ATP-binding protein [Frankia canadensis]
MTFTVSQGTVTGFLGPNGSGKTTTLRALLGLVAPNSGEALLFGRPYRELDHPARRVGAVLGNASHPGRTARDHLRACGIPLGVNRRRVEDVLATVGLEAAAERPTGGFSLGMRGRLALATALLGDPELLVLDEPNGGLDPEGIGWLRSFLRDWAARGRTALLSSHVLAEVAQTVDNVVIISEGRVVLDADVRELGHQHGRGHVEVHTPEAARLATLLAAEGLAVTAAGGDGLTLPAGTAARVGQVAARHGIALVELHTHGPDLEEVYFSLTRPLAGAAATGGYGP